MRFLEWLLKKVCSGACFYRFNSQPAIQKVTSQEMASQVQMCHSYIPFRLSERPPHCSCQGEVPLVATEHFLLPSHILYCAITTSATLLLTKYSFRVTFKQELAGITFYLVIRTLRRNITVISDFYFCVAVFGQAVTCCLQFRQLLSVQSFNYQVHLFTDIRLGNFLKPLIIFRVNNIVRMFK